MSNQAAAELGKTSIEDHFDNQEGSMPGEMELLRMLFALLDEWDRRSTTHAD